MGRGGGAWCEGGDDGAMMMNMVDRWWCWLNGDDGAMMMKMGDRCHGGDGGRVDPVDRSGGMVVMSAGDGGTVGLVGTESQERGWGGGGGDGAGKNEWRGS
ncbi:hypothetical protein Tco_0756332 [Tanacetum coccineum]